LEYLAARYRRTDEGLVAPRGVVRDRGAGPGPCDEEAGQQRPVLGKAPVILLFGGGLSRHPAVFQFEVQQLAEQVRADRLRSVAQKVLDAWPLPAAQLGLERIADGL